MGGFDDIGPFVQSIVREEQSRLHYLATVVAITGTQMTVRRLGAPAASTPEGPYATQQGVAGAVKTGDMVAVDWVRGHPIIGFAVEGAARSNLMTIVGEDDRPITITSHTTWQEINRVDGLAIAGDGFVILHWYCHAQLVAPSGPGNMQVRFKVNDTLPIGGSAGLFDVGPDSPDTEKTTSFPLWLGSYSTAGMKYQERFFATFIQTTVLGVLEIEEVNSISVEGRTMDAANGTDYLQGQNLRVFA